MLTILQLFPFPFSFFFSIFFKYRYNTEDKLWNSLFSTIISVHVKKKKGACNLNQLLLYSEVPEERGAGKYENLVPFIHLYNSIQQPLNIIHLLKRGRRRRRRESVLYVEHRFNDSSLVTQSFSLLTLAFWTPGGKIFLIFPQLSKDRTANMPEKFRIRPLHGFI